MARRSAEVAIERPFITLLKAVSHLAVTAVGQTAPRAGLIAVVTVELVAVIALLSERRLDDTIPTKCLHRAAAVFAVDRFHFAKGGAAISFTTVAVVTFFARVCRAIAAASNGETLTGDTAIGRGRSVADAIIALLPSLLNVVAAVRHFSSGRSARSTASRCSRSQAPIRPARLTSRRASAATG